MGEPGQNRYGLTTAVAMVVGIVIGSGVFFKAEAVMEVTGGDLKIGIAAWLIGGLVMLSCAYPFSVMAGMYGSGGGLVEYARRTVGEVYGYYMGWFLTVIYYPTLTSVVAWAAARYTCLLLGWEGSGICMTLAGFLLCVSFGVNALSPILAGRLQVGTTALKLIPLLMMGLLGGAVGLRSGAFTEQVPFPAGGEPSSLFSAIAAVAFAYEGWMIAASIQGELRDGRKNLPRALMIGSFTVIFIYILYQIGLAGMLPEGGGSVEEAFSALLGKGGGKLLLLFVVLSCLGTLNGLMIGCSRSAYFLAERGRGPAPELFSRVEPETGMAVYSAVLGLLFCAGWLLYFYGAVLAEPGISLLRFDSSELPVISLYGMYLPIFFMLAVRGRGLSFWRRFGGTALGMIGCLFFIGAAVAAHGWDCLDYLLVFCAVMGVGSVFAGKKEIEKKEHL